MTYFTKTSIKEQHRQKILAILNQHEGNDAVEAIVGYLMNRIGNVISYERKKWERQMGCSGGNHYDKENRAGKTP